MRQWGPNEPPISAFADANAPPKIEPSASAIAKGGQSLTPSAVTESEVGLKERVLYIVGEKRVVASGHQASIDTPKIIIIKLKKDRGPLLTE